MHRFPTTSRARQKLMVFARVPELGRVKTRLEPELGRDRTLQIYEAMLHDILTSIGAPSQDLDIEVMWTSEQEISAATLRKFFGEYPLARQAGDSLGDRLAISLAERVYFHDAEKVMAIGVDDPTLSRASIELAFKLLDSCDWVIGPATDGGYYLIGCRAAAFTPEVFRDVPWGTERVYGLTHDRIRAAGFTLAVLAQRRDIDVPDDLREFASRVGAGHGRLGALLAQEGITK